MAQGDVFDLGSLLGGGDQQGGGMLGNLQSLFGGQALNPAAAATTGTANPPLGFMDTIGANRNAIIGLGLGMLAGTPFNRYGPAMQGFQAGAGADAAAIQNAQRQQLAGQELALRRQQFGLQQQQATQAQQNWERTFNKPIIHWVEHEDPESGDKVTVPFLQSPDGTIRQLSISQAQQLAPQVEQTGAAPGTTGAPPATAPTPAPQLPPPAAPTSETPPAPGDLQTALPPGAQYAQAQQQQQLKLNKRIAREAYSKQVGTEAAKSAGQEEAGTRVMGLIDKLEQKTKDPLFASSVGPAYEYAASQPMWNPARLVYEYGPSLAGAPTKEQQAFLGRVRSDAQAINSEMQRVYLTGQGAVSNIEREQISAILGNIAGARNPAEAQGLLNNLKGIVGTALQRGYVVPSGGAGTPPAPAPTTPLAPPRYISPDAATREIQRRQQLQQ